MKNALMKPPHQWKRKMANSLPMKKTVSSLSIRCETKTTSGQYLHILW